MATREELNIGDILRDNDPRMGDRRMTILSFDGDGVILTSGRGIRTRVSLKYIHTHDRPIRSGWSRIDAALSEPQADRSGG